MFFTPLSRKCVAAASFGSTFNPKSEYVFKFLAVNFPMAITALLNKLMRSNMGLDNAVLIPVQMATGLFVSKFLNALPSPIPFSIPSEHGGESRVHAYKNPNIDIPIDGFLTAAPLAIQLIVLTGMFDDLGFENDAFCDFTDCNSSSIEDRSRFFSEILFYSSVMTLNLCLNSKVRYQFRSFHQAQRQYWAVSDGISPVLSKLDIFKLLSTTSMAVLTMYYTFYTLFDRNLAYLCRDDDVSFDFFKYVGLRNVVGVPYALFALPSLVKAPANHFSLYRQDKNDDGRWNSYYEIKPSTQPDIFRMIQVTNVVSYLLNYVLDVTLFIEGDVDSKQVNYVGMLYVALQLLFFLYFSQNSRIPMTDR